MFSFEIAGLLVAFAIFAHFLNHLMTGVPLPRLLGYRGSEVRCADVGDGCGEPAVVVVIVFGSDRSFRSGNLRLSVCHLDDNLFVLTHQRFWL